MITTSRLTKQYRNARALGGIDLEVPTGVVFGLVGPNGAGKTTLLSILAGLRSPTSGSVSIDRSRMAVLPDAPRFEPWLTGFEVVTLSRDLAGGTGRPVDELLDEAGLADAADRRVGGYSRGMLQRLGIAATVIGDPEVLLLDEPASALDPQGRRDVLDLVRRMRGRATVVFSSHILADVQEVSDWIGVLDRGTLRFQGPVADVLDTSSGYEIRVRSSAGRLAAHLGAQDWVTEAAALDDRTVRLRAGKDAHDRLLPALVASAIPIVSLVPITPTLEDVFLEATR